MAKKTKRSRGGKKKNRASQAPGLQRPASPASFQPTGENTARDLALDARQSAAGMEAGPRSTTRTRAGGLLPPPQDGVENPDEISIPPVTASPPLPTDLEDSFFLRRASVEKAAAAQARIEHEREEAELRQTLDPRSLQKMTAEAKARRQHLQRYVKWSVGAAAAVVALAVIRVGTRGKPVIDPPPPIVHTAMAATLPQEGQHEIQGQPAGGSFAGAQTQAAAAAPAQDPAPQAQAAEPLQPAAQPAPEAVAQNAAPGAQPAAQAAETKAADPAAAPATDAPTKSALQEKKDASKLLERGKVKDAIAAGERSVALDPTDGEAWLVLGAAYQQIGKNADARRCFTSCTKEAKRGPISECREMLQ